MSVYKRGDVWWYKFRFAGREIRESAKTGSKTVAREAERVRHREIEEGYNNLSDRRHERIKTIRELGAIYLADYKIKNPRSATFAAYAVGHISKGLGEIMLVDINEQTVLAYQLRRLKEQASPKTINEEIGFLLRILGEQGDALRMRMRRNKCLKLKAGAEIGRAYSQDEKQALLLAAKTDNVRLNQPEDDEKSSSGTTRRGTRSPFIGPALALAFGTGMRNAEIRNLTWRQIDFEKRVVTVGRSKTDAGEGRTIPINDTLFTTLSRYAEWFTERFGTTNPDWYIFPARVGRPSTGNKRPHDPTRPVTTLKTSWQNVKKQVGVTGRFHDTRHTLITDLCEAGAGDQTIMDIAGHVSPQMLKRYSHIRMAAKRTALDSIG